MPEPVNDSLDTLCSTTKRLTTANGKLLALVRYLKPHSDNRGTVQETYRASWFPEVPPIKQLVQSTSRPLTLRGMHLHRSQWDAWRFVAGSAIVRLYDHESDTNRYVGSQVTAIAIPPGISHGFYTVDGCTLVYALSDEWTGGDEFGWFPFDGDPHEYIWPPFGFIGSLNISDRDLTAPRLADFKG